MKPARPFDRIAKDGMLVVWYGANEELPMRMEHGSADDIALLTALAQAQVPGPSVAVDELADESVSTSRFLDSVLEHLPAMVFVKRASDLRYERFNRAGERLLGVSRESLIGKNDYDIFPLEQAEFFTRKDREVLACGTLVDIPQEPIQTPRGVRWLHTLKIPVADSNGVPRHLIGVSMDITEQKRSAEQLARSRDQLQDSIAARTAELERTEDELARAQAELRQSQKMEAIGRLAGGVAHDFNNLLTVIGGYSELVLAKLPESDDRRAYVEQINRAAQRASDLTQQLLAFGRRQVLNPKTIDLGAVIDDMQDMLSRLLGEDVLLSVCRGPALAQVTADPNQIEQVIMNLVFNARDAMPNGGLITIETLDVARGASPLCGADARPCPAVCLRVSDNGVGMDSATLEHIFEPFFTTKPLGKGSGLGLSTAFGITKQSGGTIAVQSEPGRGTVFSIYLPVNELHEASPPDDEPPVELRGSETVLLVEDEPVEREFAAQCLLALGYRVLEASGPHEALAQAARQPFDLLLTDAVMPDGGGRALAEELTRRRPGTKVLFMSGYADDAVPMRGLLTAGAALMQKPLTRPRLASFVRRALDGRGAPEELSVPAMAHARSLAAL
jgi:two-component system, cell cycle sensor histidine kinase and response regulator CckA